MLNHFFWTDLSTYHVKESINFYTEVFNWHFEDTEGYHIAYDEQGAVCGLYETPAFFQKINMPHFWMNYIHVADLNETVEKAKKANATIELNDVTFYNGKIALIRDTMGAGFTIYEGNPIASNSNQSPNVVTRELHTSHRNESTLFYNQVFNWLLKGNNFFNLKNKKEAQYQELPNSVKGNYEYWVTEFKVKNIEEVMKKVIDLGGSIVSNDSNRIMLADCFGEAFFYIND